MAGSRRQYFLLWPTGTREQLNAAVRKLAATQHELDRQYRGLLQGQGEEENTHPLRLNKDAEATLSHFHRAALAVTRSRLQNLDALTRSLFEVFADIKGPLEPMPLDEQEKMIAECGRFASDLIKTEYVKLSGDGNAGTTGYVLKARHQLGHASLVHPDDYARLKDRARGNRQDRPTRC